MGELHYLPMSSYNNNMISLHDNNNSSQGYYWDQYFHSLGVLNTESMSLAMDHNGNYTSTTPLKSSLSCEDMDDCDDLSTGYLEDALLEFSSKRRRLLLFNDEDINTAFPNNIKDSSSWDLSQNFSFMSQMSSLNEFSDGTTTTTSFYSIGEEANTVSEVKTPEEEKSVSEVLDSPNSSSSYKDSANKENLFSVGPLGCDVKPKRKNKVISRVVYPFAVVKPGGSEDDVTLNDINERILMPPTRPVRHPVGDYACRPCVSPHGPGLSGKAVVAFTRIHTQGRGTITIIRTKG